MNCLRLTSRAIPQAVKCLLKGQLLQSNHFGQMRSLQTSQVVLTQSPSYKSDYFIGRHIGPRSDDKRQMLAALGFKVCNETTNEICDLFF